MSKTKTWKNECRDETGCCICCSNISSTDFHKSESYKEDLLQACFGVKRSGLICNACVCNITSFRRKYKHSKIPESQMQPYNYKVDRHKEDKSTQGTTKRTKRENKSQSLTTQLDASRGHSEHRKHPSQVSKQTSKVSKQASKVSKQTSKVSKQASKVSKQAWKVSKQTSNVSKQASKVSKQTSNVSKQASMGNNIKELLMRNYTRKRAGKTGSARRKMANSRVEKWKPVKPDVAKEA